MKRSTKLWSSFATKQSLAFGIAFGLFAFFCGVNTTATGQALEENVDYRAALLQRIVSTMVGLEASDVFSPAQITDFLQGTTQVQDVADTLKTNPLFLARFAQFYTQELKIGQQVGIEDIINPIGATTYANIPKSLFNYLRGGTYWGRKVLSHESQCNDATYTRGRYRIGFSSATDNITGCTCEEADLIAPYWDPTNLVKICPDVDAEDYCGPNLRYCYPPSGMYPDSLKHSVTMEPGLIAAKVVVEDKSWDEVLTTTKGVVNGTMADFIKRFGDIFGDFHAPGSYPNRLTDTVHTNADPTKTDEWYWAERGPTHAGILTSVAFHRSTNGWRAKANRAMQTFLCREFVASDASVPEPSDETDLTKKPYCKQCHIVLEPMAQFFARWPDVGNDNNYFYDRTLELDDAGSFNGVNGMGTRDFANILVQMDDYNSCAVKRAFKFVTGRTMTTHESKGLLRALTNRFVADGKKMFPVIKEIMASPAFTGVIK